MTFHDDYIRLCLTSWVHLRILIALYEGPKPLAERQLSRILGLPNTTVHRVLQSLGETRLISARKIGRSTYWSFDRDSYLFETLQPILKHCSQTQHPKRVLKSLIKKNLNLTQEYRCILFGSIVKDADKSESDIDLCILLPPNRKFLPTKKQQALEQLQEICRKKFAKSLNPLILQRSELNAQKGKELYQAISQGVVL